MKKIKTMDAGGALSKKKVDPIFLILIFSLLAYGLVMLFSASFAYGFYYRRGNSFFFISHQLVHTIIGLSGMYVISKIHYSFYKKTATLMFIITFVLLVIVLFTKGDKN